MTSYKKNTSPLLTLEGHLERITYFNKDTHYTVARFKRANPATALTVVGYMTGVGIGETIKIKGAWSAHPRYGQQFKIQSYEVTLPAAASRSIRIGSATRISCSFSTISSGSSTPLRW